MEIRKCHYAEINQDTNLIITFNPNGGTYAESHSATVNITPFGVNNAVDTSSLKYQWSLSSTAPSESSFTNTFSNNQTLSKSDNSGDYYLWIYAKNNAGNKAYVKSKAFQYATFYSITYNLNGGTLTDDAKTTYNVHDTFTLPIPSKTGYVFQGWTGSNGETPQINVTITNSTGNRSYYAVWSKALDGALRLFNSGDTNVTYSYNSETKIYDITQKAGSSGWGVGVICDGARTEIPWGYTYILQFEIYIPRSEELALDTNAMYEDGTGNDEYGTAKFYIDGEISEARTTLDSGRWVSAALYMVNDNESRNPNHKTLYSFSAFGFKLTNSSEDLTYQVRNLSVSSIDLR